MNVATTGTVYDKILGTGNSNEIKYTVAPSFGDYPDKTLFTTLGPVYAPRLYASGLDTLDLGSSGQIAFALQDQQRISMKQSGLDTVYASTGSNNLKFQNLDDSASLKVNDDSTVFAYGDSNVKLFTASNVSVLLDSAQKSIAHQSDKHSILATTRSVQVAGSNSNAYAQFESSGVLTNYAATTFQNNTSNYNLGVQVKAAISHSKSNASLEVEDGRVEVFGVSNVSIGSNVYVTAGTAYALSNVASNASIVLTDSDIKVTTNSNITNKTRSFAVDASSLATVKAGASSNAYLTLGSNGVWTGFATDSIKHNSSNFLVGVNTAATVSHKNSNASIDWSDGLLELYGYSNVSTGSNVTVIAGVSYNLYNTASNASFTLSDSTISIVAKSNLTQSTDKFLVNSSSWATVQAGASSNAYLTLNSNGTITGFATEKIQTNTKVFNLGVTDTARVSHSNSNAWIQWSNASLELFGNTTKAVGSNVFVTADVSFSLSNTASNASFRLTDSTLSLVTKSNIVNTTNLFSVGSSNTTLSAGTNASLVLDTATAAATLTGATDAWVKASSNATVRLSSSGVSTVFGTQSIDLTMAGSNAFVSVKNSNIDIFSTNTTELAVSNSNAWIQLDKTIGLTMSSSNAVNITAKNTFTAKGNDVLIASSNDNAFMSLSASGDAKLSGKSNVYLTVGAVNVLKADSNGITVLGNMDIAGSINSINVVQTELSVFDKVIRLSDQPGQSNGVDGYASNHQSGLVVVGLPSGVTTDPFSKFDKSILWNFGQSNGIASDGAVGVGKADWTKESFWEVLGGSLRITCNRDSGLSSSYGFRINDKDELEIIKASQSNGIWSYKRISRFGVSTGR